MLLSHIFEHSDSSPREIYWKPSNTDQNAITTGDETIVWVDVAKIEAAWSSDPDFYVGPKGSHNAIGQRYDRFGEWLKTGRIVEMPFIGFDSDRERPFFINGRHRFAWIRDRGAQAIPVCTHLPIMRKNSKKNTEQRLDELSSNKCLTKFVHAGMKMFS